MNKLLMFLLLSIPACCLAQNVDTLDAKYGYEGELIFIYKDSMDTGLTDQKKIMLDTLAQQMENWSYKGFFITKLYCYYIDENQQEFDSRIASIRTYLGKKNKIKHDYFEVVYVNLRDEKFLYSELEHIRIFKKFDKTLRNPYK